MEKLRLGVIGYGNMGTGHVGNIMKGKVPSIVIGAVCDCSPARLEACKASFPEIPTFDNPVCIKCKRLAICGGLCYKRKVNFIQTHKHSCVKPELDTDVDDFVKEYYHTRIKKRQIIHQKQS